MTVFGSPCRLLQVSGTTSAKPPSLTYAGRFLQTDPIPGGNANAYGYPEDPINGKDPDGRMRAEGDDGVTVNVLHHSRHGYNPDSVYRRQKQPHIWRRVSGTGVSVGGCLAIFVGSCVSISINRYDGFTFSHATTGYSRRRSHLAWGVSGGPSLTSQTGPVGDGRCTALLAVGYCSDSRHRYQSTLGFKGLGYMVGRMHQRSWRLL